MKKTTQVLFFAASLFLTPLAAQAEFTNAKCDYVLTGSGEIQINRQWDVEAGVCFIDIHPRNPVGMKYRDFYFDNLGHMLVFNSFGEGSDASMTGARDYFLFPIVNSYPDFSIEENGDVIVKMVSNHLFRISAKDFSMLSLTPGTFTEKPVSSGNLGGVEIKPASGYWIDGGFKKGGSRLSSPNLKSVIKSAAVPNLKCEILNKDLLKYSSDGNYTFKYEKEALSTFIKQKCPAFTSR